MHPDSWRLLQRERLLWCCLRYWCTGYHVWAQPTTKQINIQRNLLTVWNLSMQKTNKIYRRKLPNFLVHWKMQGTCTRSLGLSYPKHALTWDMSLSNQPPILIQITNVTIFSYTNFFIASTLLTHPNALRNMQGITSQLSITM